MPVRKARTAPRKPSLHPEGLRKEAQTLRRTALKAIDAGMQQDFEDMAIDRELLAQALEELEKDPPRDEKADEKSASKNRR